MRHAARMPCRTLAKRLRIFAMQKYGSERAVSKVGYFFDSPGYDGREEFSVSNSWLVPVSLLRAVNRRRVAFRFFQIVSDSRFCAFASSVLTKCRYAGTILYRFKIRNLFYDNY